MELQNRPAVGLVIASVGVIAVGFVPILREAALLWWVLGLTGLALALVRSAKSMPRRTRSVAFSATAFVAAAAAAIALVGVTMPSSAQAAPSGGSAAGTGPDRIVQLAADLEKASSTAASGAIDSARALGYEPRSGLEPDWDAASA